MTMWIALLRGINVVGRNRLTMGELVSIFESLGLEDVETYIQSGNVVFRSSGEVSPALDEEIAGAIEDRHGFRPRVLILGPDRLREAIESNPFPEAEVSPKAVHLYFLMSEPDTPDPGSLARLAAPTERFHVAGDILYLHAPDGIGRSKLAAAVEKRLGVAATARNWRTVRKLWAMAGSADRDEPWTGP